MSGSNSKGPGKKFWNNLLKVGIITICWVSIWTLLFLYDYSTTSTLIPREQLSIIYDFNYYLIGNITGGLFGGLLGGSLLVYKLNESYRERSFIYGIVNSSILFVIVYTAISFLMAVLFSLGTQEIKEIDQVIFNITSQMFYNSSFWTSMMIWSLMVGGTQFMLQVNDKFGSGVLWQFLTGKYFHPREEKRIFMFLDIRSSTSIAEKIGHMKYFELLKAFYMKITDPIINCGGQIYQYVGDEVIVTWNEEKGITNNNCIRCFFEIQRTIQDRKDFFMDSFGFVPRFKAGVHVGEATVGEIGIMKKDIVYTGDVLNTTARIQAECNTYNVDILISAELLSMLRHIDDDYGIEAKGVFSLKGKENVIGLISISEKKGS